MSHQSLRGCSGPGRSLVNMRICSDHWDFPSHILLMLRQFFQNSVNTAEHPGPSCTMSVGNSFGTVTLGSLKFSHSRRTMYVLISLTYILLWVSLTDSFLTVHCQLERWSTLSSHVPLWRGASALHGSRAVYSLQCRIQLPLPLPLCQADFFLFYFI